MERSSRPKAYARPARTLGYQRRLPVPARRQRPTTRHAPPRAATRHYLPLSPAAHHPLPTTQRYTVYFEKYGDHGSGYFLEMIKPRGMRQSDITMAREARGRGSIDGVALEGEDGGEEGTMDANYRAALAEAAEEEKTGVEEAKGSRGRKKKPPKKGSRQRGKENLTEDERVLLEEELFAAIEPPTKGWSIGSRGSRGSRGRRRGKKKLTEEARALLEEELFEAIEGASDGEGDTDRAKAQAIDDAFLMRYAMSTTRSSPSAT